ncbi:MAG: 50S ribosomal protein L23 [Thermoprotei archaeon]
MSEDKGETKVNEQAEEESGKTSSAKPKSTPRKKASSKRTRTAEAPVKEAAAVAEKKPRQRKKSDTSKASAAAAKSSEKPQRGGRRRGQQRQKQEKQRTEAALQAYRILIRPLATEKTIGMIEKQNTLTFIVDGAAAKHVIKRAAEQLYDVKVSKVRTLNSPLNQKKAFIKLDPAFKAQEIATRLGIL